MMRNSLLNCVTMLVCVIAPTVTKAMTVDEQKPVPADAVEAKPAPRVSLSSVTMIPVYSVGADLHALHDVSVFLRDRVANEVLEDYVFFELVDQSAHLVQTPSAAKFGFNGYLTRPSIEFYGDLTCSLPKSMADELKQDSDVKKHDDGVYEIDGMTVVLTESSYGMCYGDNLEYSPEDAARLRRLIRDTAKTSNKHACFIKSEPYKIGRSALKPQLNAVRSMLHTQAQRRDDEPELNYLFRATEQRTLVSLLDAFFNETKSVQYSLDFNKNDPSVTISITIHAVKGTTLDKYVSRLGSHRSRLLSYLHPEQRGFVSASIPLSDDLATNVPGIMGLGASAIAGVDATKPLAGVEHALRQIADEKSIECLVQMLPGSDDTLSYMMIVPLQEAASLKTPLIQLVSAVDESNGNSAADLGSVGQWPIHNLNLGVDTDSGKKHSFVVTTDDCIALCIAAEDDMPYVKAVLERDFEETKAAKRFQRSAFAIATTHSSLNNLSHQVFGDFISDLKVPDDGSKLPDGRIELSLQTVPHELTVVARFDNDAIGDGALVFGTSVEWLLELAVNLYE